jgi:hypothetical protein
VPIRNNFADMLNVVVPEVYFCRNFLRKIGYSFEPTVASWWQVLTDLFIVVDRTALEHFWPKYNYTTEHRTAPDDQLRNEAICGFRDWLEIMNFCKMPNIEIEDLLAQKPNEYLRRAS